MRSREFWSGKNALAYFGHDGGKKFLNISRGNAAQFDNCELAKILLKNKNGVNKTSYDNLMDILQSSYNHFTIIL